MTRMPLDMPQTEYVQPKQETIPESTAEYTTALHELYETTSKEQQQEQVRLGNQIDKLSSNGAKTYPVFLGNKKVGSLVKCEAEKGRTNKAMFASADRSPAWFTKDAQGNYFPNIAEIQKYFADKAKQDGTQIEVTMITTGPMFKSYNANTMAGINYDNGKSVGSDGTNLQGPDTKGMAMMMISGGQITFDHQYTMSDQKLQEWINKQADIMTMPSMKRDGNINNNASLRNHKNGHALVQFTDGTRGELILNGCSPEEKKQVVAGLPEISRAVYADGDAATNFLDGIWIQTPQGLKYSHPDQGDLFVNENAKSPAEVKNHMPGIIIHYAVK